MIIRRIINLPLRIAWMKLKIQKTQFTAIEKSFRKNEGSRSGHCYELLTLFWYHKKSMNELTQIFWLYSNVDNTKVQNQRQKRLEKMAFNELNN
jgi:hypothetical protein